MSESPIKLCPKNSMHLDNEPYLHKWTALSRYIVGCCYINKTVVISSKIIKSSPSGHVLLCFQVITDIGESLWSSSFLRVVPRSTYPRNGSPTCHLALFLLREPGVAGSSPFTLTTSLVIPIPSSSSSNRPTTTPLTTRGFCPDIPARARFLLRGFLRG